MFKRFFLFITLALFFVSSAAAIELKFNTQDFSPFSYIKNGKVSGPAVDIIRTVCLKIEVNCSFKLMVWKDAQQEVRNGKAHGMFVIGWNKGRSEWLYFSPQIIQTEYGFFVAKGNTLNYREIRDLSGYKVGVYGPSNTARSLQKISKKMEKDKTMTPIQIDMRPDDVGLFSNLDSPERSIVSVYSNRDVGKAIIRKSNLKNLRYAGAQRKLNYYIGFSRKYTGRKLVERFNIAYIELYREGGIASILGKYAMVPATIEPHIIKYYTQYLK